MTCKKSLTLKSLLLGTTLVFASAVLVSAPHANIAFAKNGGGNGGGKGGGNGGGNGNGGANGGGHADGNSAGHAADHANGGNSNANKSTTPDDSPTPSQLGKLNGFLHASPQALDSASPNSAPGTISQTFRDLLRDYAAQQETETSAEGTPADPNAVSMDDLAGVLAEATNKKMSPATVNEVMDRLTEVYGDDYSSLDDVADDTTEDTADDDPEQKSFAQELSDRVNEINGYAPASDEDENPS